MFFFQDVFEIIQGIGIHQQLHAIALFTLFAEQQNLQQKYNENTSGKGIQDYLS